MRWWIVAVLFLVGGCAVGRPEYRPVPAAEVESLDAKAAKCASKGGRWTKVEGVWHCLAR